MKQGQVLRRADHEEPPNVCREYRKLRGGWREDDSLKRKGIKKSWEWSETVRDARVKNELSCFEHDIRLLAVYTFSIMILVVPVFEAIMADIK